MRRKWLHLVGVDGRKRIYCKAAGPDRVVIDFHRAGINRRRRGSHLLSKGRKMAEDAAPLDVSQLVADYHQALYRYAFRLSGSVADAEDLTQQAFLAAHQKLDQVRSAACVRGWLFVVLRNCYLKSRRQRLPAPAATLELDIDQVPDEVIDRPIDSERLQMALDALDDDFKIVVLLFYFEHRSYREIAATLDLPVGTVMSRLARAKARLRRCLCEMDRDDVHASHHAHRHALAKYSEVGPRAASS